MASQIEKMNKMRRNILLGVLIGVVIMFGWFMLPTFFIKFRFRLFDTALKGAGITGLLILFIFGTRYWIYKNSLKKDSTLRAAVNDERIKLNWLKAYRFSFYIIICITIFLKLWDMLLLVGRSDQDHDQFCGAGTMGAVHSPGLKNRPGVRSAVRRSLLFRSKRVGFVNASSLKNHIVALDDADPFFCFAGGVQLAF